MTEAANDSTQVSGQDRKKTARSRNRSNCRIWRIPPARKLRKKNKSRYESFPCTHNLGERNGQVWRDNNRRVRTHEKLSRYAVGGSGTKIENVFVPNQEPAFALIFGNGLAKVGTKGLFCVCFSRLFSRADLLALGPRGCFFFFLYCPVLY